MRKLSLVISIFVGTLAAAGLGYLVYTLRGTSTKRSDEPIIFYEKNIISSFDSAGNPIGQKTIIRQDGLNGKPRTIFSYPGNHQLGNSSDVILHSQRLLVQYREQGDGVSVEPTSPLVRVTLDFSGQELERNVVTTKDQVRPDEQIPQSDDRRWAAAISVICAEQEPEGPCHDDFSIMVMDVRNGKKNEYTGTSLHIPMPMAKTVDLVGFNTASTDLIVRVHEQQEAGYDAILSIALESGEVKTLWQNAVSDLGPDAVLIPVFAPRYLEHLSVGTPERFNDHVYFQKYLMTGNSTLTQFDLGTETFRDILTAAMDFGVHIDPTERYVAYNADQRVVIYDMHEDANRQTQLTGTVFGWSSNGRYIATETLTHQTVAGPKSGVVAQFPEGVIKTIFRQTSLGNAYQLGQENQATISKVGDVLYATIGLY